MGTGGILIVEDWADDAEFLLLALRAEGIKHPVTILKTGRATVAHLVKASDLPSLILLDAVLLDIPGVEVLRLLRDDSRSRDIPVVLFAEAARPYYKQAAHQLDAEFLVKPFRQSALRKIFRRLNARWLAPRTDVTRRAFQVIQQSKTLLAKTKGLLDEFQKIESQARATFTRLTATRAFKGVPARRMPAVWVEGIEQAQVDKAS